jgi:hypothetical protein
MLKIIEQLAKNTNIYENKTNMSVISVYHLHPIILSCYFFYTFNIAHWKSC